MLLIEYVGHIGLRSLTDGHLGCHLEYFKTLNDARVASLGFIKYIAPTTRINKEKNFKIKFQVILVSTGLYHTGQCKSTGGCYNELVVAYFGTGGGVKWRKR